MAFSPEQEPFPYFDVNVELQEGTRCSLDGDFYREPDDVVRSCEVQRDIGMSFNPYDSIGQGFAAFKGCDDDDDGFSAAGLSNDFLQNRAPFLGSSMDYTHMRHECRDDLAFPVFALEHVPSEIPIDPLFHFAATTVQITLPPHMIAADIGNLLLDIFETKMHALVKKVRPFKFWIKVDVFVNYVMCTLKVQVYRTAKDDTYIVEFMRRGGDTIAFMTTFQQACDFLNHNDISLSVVGDAGSQLPHPCSCSVANLLRSAMDHEHGGDEHLEALLAPVLDMAAMCSQPLLQTESAVILAQIVERNAEKAAGLCTGTVFQAIRHLLSAKLVETLYPTACLLLQLASCQHAEPFFADYAFLMALLEQVRSEAQKCRALVTHRLALVISISIKRCGPRLSFESAQRLRANVSHVLKEVSSRETRNCLQEVVKAISKIIE